MAELVRKMNARTSAADLGEKKVTIPSPPQVFWAIVNSLPRLPAIPTISRPSTAVTEAEEEVIIAPEVEEFPSPQSDIIRLVYE